MGRLKLTAEPIYSKTAYEIEVRNPTGAAQVVWAVSIDGRAGVVDAGAARVPVVVDGALHRVVVTLARS
jgi:hypothetical protein